MVTPELLTFIRAELAKSETVDAIKQSLIQKNWQQEDIDQAFVLVQKPQNQQSSAQLTKSEDNTTSLNENLVFKQSYASIIFQIVIISVFILFVTIPISEKWPFFWFIGITLIIITVLTGYSSFTTLVLNTTGLSIVTKRKTETILWPDIISMSTAWVNKTFSYEIKTNKKSYRLQAPEDFNTFEQYIVNKASLEVEEQSESPELLFSDTKIRRWKKIGGEYSHTSSLDWFADFSYPKSKSFFIVIAVAGGFFALAQIFIDYLVKQGYAK